jgi:undecaprenyl-diphosphatase
MDGKPLPLTLNIALHVGTLAAVLFYFWQDFLAMGKAGLRRLTAGTKSFEADVLIPGLIIGSIPAGIIGILWEKKIEALFHNPLSVCFPLALVGIGLWLVDKKMPSDRNLTDLTIKDAFLIGIAQACALIPGFSRSGSTILGARLLRFDRSHAARFSFILGTPAMGGAVLLNYKDILASIGDPQFYIGISVSAAVGCMAIAFLLNFLKKFGFFAFAVYRLILAVIILAIVL